MDKRCGTCRYSSTGCKSCWDLWPGEESKWKPKVNEYTKIGTRYDALRMVNKERSRQDEKWGIQNHAQQAWVGILGEEFGEYCQCVNETYLANATKKHEGGYDRILEELTHVAAVAVGAMESLMRNREVK